MELIVSLAIFLAGISICGFVADLVGTALDTREAKKQIKKN